jgi:hypothetical protein
MTPTVETSPLLQRMRGALDRLKPDRGYLHVSVARDLRWEKSPSNGDEVLVRWLCWSINDGDTEISPPEFEVVAKDVTPERLARELPAIFTDVEVIVDDDIDV